MATLRDARGTFAARALSLGFAAASACSLSGCGGVDYASSSPAFPGDFQERHPIVVASAPTRLDIYPVGGALDPRSVANIRAFVERYRHFGSGIVTILAPAGTARNSKAVYAVRSALANAGLTGKVAIGTYALLITGPTAPIRLSFTGLKAVVPTICGQWPEDLASGSSVEGWKNEPYSNFGCASQAMMASQVDDPRDFVQARALDPSDVAMRTRAIEDVRNGEDPGTQWKDTVLVPIGQQVGGGGQ
jgi:pilus assembly protein CpaD